MNINKRLSSLPSYPFGLVRKRIEEVEKSGDKVLRCYIGVPDKGFLPKFKEKYIELARSCDFKSYPIDRYGEKGSLDVRETIAEWYNKKFPMANIDPENIVIVGWTKEVLHNLARLVDPGECLIPDPVYPAYVSAAILSEHTVKTIGTRAEDWLPNFEPNNETSILYFCDPNNPTGSIAPKDFYESLDQRVESYDGICVFDGAYVDLVWDDSRIYSPMEFENLRNKSFHVISLSKSYNTVADGIGFVVASKENIETFLKLYETYSQGVAYHKQLLLKQALSNDELLNEAKEYRESLKNRINLFSSGLMDLGFEIPRPRATPYLWIKTPIEDDKDFVFRLIEECRVAFMFGSAFGKSGSGYMRATVYISEDEIKEALERMEKNRFW